MSHKNLIGLIYWNRDRDNDLVFNSYYKNNTWSSNFLNKKITIPGKKFIMVVRYRGTSKQFVYETSEPDADADGIPDSKDRCPNQAGPASNNGCPKPKEKYDLTFDMFFCTAFSSCRDCNTRIDRLGSKKHRLSQLDAIHLNYGIINKAKGKSNRTKLKAFVNYNGKKIELKDLSRDFREVPKLNRGNVEISNAIITFSNFREDTFKEFPNGNYNLMIEIQSTPNESNTSNNTLVLPVEVKKQGFSSKNSPKRISIKDFNGTIIKQNVIKNKEEEKEIIKSLPKGLYIIKKDKEIKKIYKQD